MKKFSWQLCETFSQVINDELIHFVEHCEPL